MSTATTSERAPCTLCEKVGETHDIFLDEVMRCAADPTHANHVHVDCAISTWTAGARPHGMCTVCQKAMRAVRGDVADLSVVERIAALRAESVRYLVGSIVRPWVYSAPMLVMVFLCTAFPRREYSTPLPPLGWAWLGGVETVWSIVISMIFIGGIFAATWGSTMTTPPYVLSWIWRWFHLPGRGLSLPLRCVLIPLSTIVCIALDPKDYCVYIATIAIFEATSTLVDLTQQTDFHARRLYFVGRWAVIVAAAREVVAGCNTGDKASVHTTAEMHAALCSMAKRELEFAC